MYTLRRVFAFLTALLVTSLGGAAQAQTTTTGAVTLTLNTKGIVHKIPRTNNRDNTLINRADCDSDDEITFPVTLANFGADSLQGWVGTTNCTDAAIRQSTTQTQCWKVFDEFPTGQFPNTPNVTIPVKRMLAGYSCGTIDTSGTAGASSTGGDTSAGGSSGGTATTAGTGGDTTTTPITSASCPIYPILSLVNPDPDICTRTASIAAAGATTLTLYLMLVDPSSLAATAQASWVATFKLVGPPAPDNVTAGIGGNLLVMNFSYTNAPVDQTGNGFNLYCDPPKGRDVAVDAGLIDADASTGPEVKCNAPTSQVLVPNQLPPTDSQYLCGGTASKNAQSANATNLVNGVVYNVAVSAVDTYGNTGPLSKLTCEVPQPIIGFFKGYQDAGGQAGGGFCSFSRHREPLTLIAVLGFASYLVLRRRRAA